MIKNISLVAINMLKTAQMKVHTCMPKTSITVSQETLTTLKKLKKHFKAKSYPAVIGILAHEHEEKQLEAQDHKDEHAITQSISEKKILELTTFNLKTVQKFCDFSYLDPNSLYYVCADKYCPIHLPRNRRLTTYICKLCHKKRQEDRTFILPSHAQN